MTAILDRPRQLDHIQAEEILAAQLRVICTRIDVSECSSGGVLIEILKEELDEFVRRTFINTNPIEDPESGISVGAVAACCDFIAKGTFIALNEPPQASIEHLTELIAELRHTIRKRTERIAGGPITYSDSVVD
ncbi:MAG TPA: hypothetical protein VIW73_13525 [Candidatus Cybelea sp.]